MIGMLLYVTCLVAWRIWETTKREGGAAFTADHKSNSELLASFFFGFWDFVVSSLCWMKGRLDSLMVSTLALWCAHKTNDWKVKGTDMTVSGSFARFFTLRIPFSNQGRIGCWQIVSSEHGLTDIYELTSNVTIILSRGRTVSLSRFFMVKGVGNINIVHGVNIC